MALEISKLNEEQRTAVTAGEGPVLILAGAGSGKTRVLTYRVAYLLDELKVHPEQILALTFTNKAAKEMKERITSLIDHNPPSWVSTFHSACVRILRREISLLGYGNDFLIYDAKDKLKIVKDIVSDMNLDTKRYPPQSMARKISSIKNCQGEDRPDFFYPLDEIYHAYQKRLKRENALDFDDLLLKTTELFEEFPDRLQYYQNKFQHILVDEYQDTNQTQNKLINLLAPPKENVFVVGDDDQSIYLFRGADVKNILEFEGQFPDAKVIKLEKNYRSTKTILEAANQVVHQNPDRKPKELWTDNDEGDRVKYFEADNERDEAHFIASEIRKNSYNLPLMAVLYRTNAQSRVLEDVFRREGINYTMVGGTGFYDRKEVKDIMAYLMIIQSPEADSQLERIINEPKRGIGKTSLDKIINYARRNEISLFDALQEIDFVEVSKKVNKSVHKFVELITNFQKMREYLTVKELVEQVTEKTGYLEALRKQNNKEAEDRIDNIKEIYSMAKEFEDEGGETLEEFLTYNSLMGDIDTWEEEEQAEVVMMTLHSAKGLEFPAVFLTGLEKGVFPHFKALEDEASMAEERRLCYVGITRAEQVLYLSWARERTLHGKTQRNMQSEFISEIKPELIEDVGGSSLASSSSLVGSGSGETSFGKTASASSRSGLSKGPTYEKPKASASSFSSGSNFTPAEEMSFAKGDKISHKKWGEGEVIQAQQAGGDWILTVNFEDLGTKKLAAGVAPIKKL